MKNGDMPINPIWMTKNGEQSYTALKDGQKTGYEKHFGGLTKREYFAIISLQGILANELLGQINTKEQAIQAAISYADELLNQLEKTTNEKSI